MIIFHLSPGLTILACESRVSDHMDLGPSELVGCSYYQFIHGQDATRIRQSHRTGGFVWLQSVATVAGSGKSPGEHHALWLSHVLSQAEGGQTPLDAFQLPASMTCKDASSPGPEPTEPETPAEGNETASLEKEAPQMQGKRIKVEPVPRETKGSEDSGD
ncbi:Neuronal PAS domain-containing protein 1 [Saguinus oedipus]|uniref:Neuronal PAS domain-containing protein 1 n=1 Tax=Saguinus oedipus TaxID=9490 RepID=A0ABQ9U747_SAGOE|nr:Neuronal PAS domain-containing protein 1 [Saguinus oedipus]